MTSRRPDQVSSIAQTLLSTRPVGSATSRTTSSDMSVGTPEDRFGQAIHSPRAGHPVAQSRPSSCRQLRALDLEETTMTSKQHAPPRPAWTAARSGSGRQSWSANHSGAPISGWSHGRARCRASSATASPSNPRARHRRRGPGACMPWSPTDPLPCHLVTIL